MPNEDIISALQAERDAHLQRVAAIDLALDALGNGPIPSGYGPRAPQVGDDKLAIVREDLKRHSTPKSPHVRQADITQRTGLNSGTVSQAMQFLQLKREVEPGPKLNRSQTWRLVAA